MRLRFDPVCIVLEDEDGRLVFADERLVAVLVRLSAVHGADAGRWFLESAYLRNDCDHPIFASLEDAETWIVRAIDRPSGGRAGH